MVLAVMGATNLRIAAASKTGLETIRLIEKGDLKQAHQALAGLKGGLMLSPGGLKADYGHAVIKRLMSHDILEEQANAPSQAAPTINAVAVRISQSSSNREWSQSLRQFAVQNKHQRLKTGPGIKQDLHQLAALAYDGLSRNVKLHPLDIHLSLLRGRIALQMAYQFDDPRRLSETEQELERALSYSPKCQEVQHVLAAVKLCLSKPKQAIALLEAATYSLPKHNDSWWRLAEVYQAIGQTHKAQEIARQAKHHGVLILPASISPHTTDH